MDRFDLAGQAFARLCRTMAKLRSKEGCPWDREQTAASLKPCLIEETYEAIDAIDAGDPTALREELGDVLLQVVFLAELATEAGDFDCEGVVAGINEKLIRRHPHVFGELSADNAKAALSNWEAVKATERPKERGLLDSIPRAMPALLRAMRSGQKASTVGFDWSSVTEVLEKLDEERAELETAMAQNDQDAARDELGDLLFTTVNLSRRLKLDPEAALQHATDKFQRRFSFLERRARELARPLKGMSPTELDDLWCEAKRDEERTADQVP